MVIYFIMGENKKQSFTMFVPSEHPMTPFCSPKRLTKIFGICLLLLVLMFLTFFLCALLCKLFRFCFS